MLSGQRRLAGSSRDAQQLIAPTSRLVTSGEYGQDKKGNK